jgi:hypothetical protein
MSQFNEYGLYCLIWLLSPPFPLRLLNGFIASSHIVFYNLCIHLQIFYNNVLQLLFVDGKGRGTR